MAQGRSIKIISIVKWIQINRLSMKNSPSMQALGAELSRRAQARAVVTPAPCTLHPAPCTLHPALCTLHPAPCTLHPAPCTLHPEPCTLIR